MATCHHHHRRPPPPVRTAADALTALAVATDAGRDPCVVVACLDQDRRPLTMFVVDGFDGGSGPRAREVLGLALGSLVDAVRDEPSAVDAVVLALSRPGEPAEPDDEDLATFADLERRCAEAGILLLDWYIVADRAAWSVGHRLGRPSAW